MHGCEFIDLCSGGTNFPVRTNDADNPMELYVGDIDTEQSTKQQDTRESDGRVTISF